MPVIWGLQSIPFTSLKICLNVSGSLNPLMSGFGVFFFLWSNTEFLRTASNQPGTHAEDRSFFPPFAVAFQVFVELPTG